ncbi:MAG TPA: hypothetical protein VFH66_16210 [Mycobacteriales bacterium]|nr:hypothetical protein [Mycobacteriales bacterium]
MAAGAVLALAVTVHNSAIDIQTTGGILVWVGLLDLLVNVGLVLYRRRINSRY